jgi:hypothetical protein
MFSFCSNIRQFKISIDILKVKHTFKVDLIHNDFVKVVCQMSTLEVGTNKKSKEKEHFVLEMYAWGNIEVLLSDFMFLFVKRIF